MFDAPVGVYVPASTANLGPGFDCLGLALGFGLRAQARPAKRTIVRVRGEGRHRLARDERNLVYRSLKRTLAAAGQPPRPVQLDVNSEIPLARGLGSSSAAIVAGVLLANALIGGSFSAEAMLKLAWEIEGHPDNVAPALLGGCVICVVEDDALHHLQVPVPAELQAVLFIPDFEMSTGRARAVLPEKYSRADCVFNAGRTALLVGALSTGRLDLLRVATQDRLHQPARSQVFPALPDVIQAAIDSGASAAFLSGAGSTVCALTVDAPERIGDAMVVAARAGGFGGTIRLTRPVAEGGRIVPAVEQVWE